MSADDVFSLRFRLKKAIKDRLVGPPPLGESPIEEAKARLQAERSGAPGPSPAGGDAGPPPPGDTAAPERTPAPDEPSVPAALLAPLRLLVPCEDAVHAARVLESVSAAAPGARFTARVAPGGAARRFLFVEIPGGRGAREALAAAAEATREAGAPALIGLRDGYRPADPGSASSDAPAPTDDLLRVGTRAGDDPTPGEADAEVDLAGWPVLGVREMVGALPLLRNRLPEPSSRVYVRLPATLLRGAVVRLSQARVTCRAAGVRVDRFADLPHLRDQVLLAVEDPGGSPLPEHLLEALQRLAGTAVYRPADAHYGDRFLVERGYHLPLSGRALAALVADSEGHLFGGPGTGHLVLDPRPDFRPVPIPASGHLPGAPERAEVTAAKPIARVVVRLVPRPPGPASHDGLLLTEKELDWLARLLPKLPGRWLDRLQVVPGRGRSLLIGDGPLPPALPFGVPLRRRDPPTLFVEAHHDLDPDLDREALRGVLGLGDDTIEVWLPAARLRFPLAAAVPVSDLYAADPARVPERVEPLDEGFAWKLERGRRADTETAEDEGAATPGGISLDGRRALLADAARLASAGQFGEAAEIHERMGDFAKAARLYERAAEDEERRRARRRG